MGYINLIVEVDSDLFSDLELQRAVGLYLYNILCLLVGLTASIDILI